MLLYNVTINVHPNIHDRWLLWMNEVHIPEVLATGKFQSARLLRVLVEDETGAATYAAQYTAPDRESLERYYSEDAPGLRDKGLQLWGDQALYFRTELEVLADHHPVQNRN